VATRTVTIQTVPFNTFGTFTDPNLFAAATEREHMQAGGYLSMDEIAFRLGINAGVVSSNMPAITPVTGVYGNYCSETSVAAWAAFRGLNWTYP